MTKQMSKSQLIEKVINLSRTIETAINLPRMTEVEKQVGNRSSYTQGQLYGFATALLWSGIATEKELQDAIDVGIMRAHHRKE